LNRSSGRDGGAKRPDPNGGTGRADTTLPTDWAAAPEGTDGTTLRQGHGLSYMGLRVTQYALLFLVTVVTARELGPDGRAEYALPLAFAGAIWVLCHLSLEVAASRLISHGSHSIEAIGQSLAAFAVLLSAVGMALAIGLGIALGDTLLADPTIWMLVLASLTIPGLLGSQFAGQLLLLSGDIRRHGVVNLIAAALQLSLVVVLALSGHLTPATALAATTVGFLAVGGLMAWSLARVHGFRVLTPRPRRTLTPTLLKTGLTYHPASVAVQFSPRFDLLIVGAFVSTAQAGTYSLALTLADAMFFAAQSLTLAAMPRQLRGDLEDAIRFTLQFARQSLLLTLSIAAIASALAYPFVIVIYGQAFESAVLPLVILLFAGASFALEAPSRILLIRIASPALVTSIVSAGVGLNLTLTVVLTKTIGLAGAALGSLVSFWLLAVALLAVVGKRTGQSLRPLIARPSKADEVLILPIAMLRRALAAGFQR